MTVMGKNGRWNDTIEVIKCVVHGLTGVTPASVKSKEVLTKTNPTML